MKTPLLILLAPSAGSLDAVFWTLNAGMIFTGFGWGATEGSINALTTPNNGSATLSPAWAIRWSCSANPTAAHAFATSR